MKPNIKNNFYWMFADRFLNLALALIVTTIIARHYGPQDYGLFSFIVATYLTFGIIGHMGLAGYLEKQLASDKKNYNILLREAITFKGMGFCLAFLGINLFSYINFSDNYEIRMAILSVSGIYFIRPLESLDHFFISRLESSINTTSRIYSTIIGASLKFYIVFINYEIIWILYAHIFQIFIKPINVDKNKFKSLFNDTWQLYLSAVSALLLLKVDKIMLMSIIGPREVGIYQISTIFSEITYFIPAAIMASFTPRLVSIQGDKARYHKEIQKIADLIAYSSISIILITYFLAPLILVKIFGTEYISAIDILKVHIFGCLFIYMRIFYERMLIIDKKFHVIFISSILGMILNILLNYILIPGFEGMGAAYATLISYGFSYLLIPLIYNESKIYVSRICDSFCNPKRILKIIHIQVKN